jgi:hypothetical protein
MVKKAIVSTIALIAFTGLSASATIINIPDDYATIQEGIDAGGDGDTVLVQAGTYVENINFNGHDIVLGSLFLTTGDPSFIEQTVIDGDQQGSVVTFASGETVNSVIEGFTITNGSGTYFDPYWEYGGGGIYCNGSAPTIQYNIITRSHYTQYHLREFGQRNPRQNWRGRRDGHRLQFRRRGLP